LEFRNLKLGIDLRIGQLEDLEFVTAPPASGGRRAAKSVNSAIRQSPNQFHFSNFTISSVPTGIDDL
jgi:hypothetical protein